MLARLSLGYGFWRRLNLFKHGQMELPRYALEVFKRHFSRIDITHRTKPLVIMEIGPGDTLFSALIARSLGASRCYLVDIAPFACRNIKLYRQMILELRKHGLAVDWAEQSATLDEILANCGAVYLTSGLASFDEIPDATIDFIFSHACLQHVRRKDFIHLISEMLRVLRPGGICSHEVDLSDCLGGKLNNLRFSERILESEFMAQSGFYTNRIRFQEMLSLFSEVGFECDVVRTAHFPALPTPRRSMAARFKDISDEDLLVSNFDIVLRRKLT